MSIVIKTRNISIKPKKCLIKQNFLKNNLSRNDIIKSHLGTKLGMGANTKDYIKVHLGYNKTKKILKRYVPRHHTKSIYLFYRNQRYFFSFYLKKQFNSSYIYRTNLIMYNYKGFRILKGLPVRGQRTRSNAKNSRNRNILGAGNISNKSVKALSNVLVQSSSSRKYKKNTYRGKKKSNKKYFKHKKR